MADQPGRVEQPSDDRVRVPHLTRPQLITTPRGQRHRLDNQEHAARAGFVIGHKERTIHSVVRIGDHALTPAAQLIPEESDTSQDAATRPGPRARPPRRTVLIRDRALRLDHKAALQEHGPPARSARDQAAAAAPAAQPRPRRSDRRVARRGHGHRAGATTTQSRTSGRRRPKSTGISTDCPSMSCETADSGLEVALTWVAPHVSRPAQAGPLSFGRDVPPPSDDGP